MKCRNCFSDRLKSFLNLGEQPLSNGLIKPGTPLDSEKYYPLEVFFCQDCLFVQIDSHGKASEIFNDDYVYYSSVNPAFLSHAKKYVDDIVPLLSLNQGSFVVEAASNDGYLLKNFRDRNIPHLGVEPTGCADMAMKQGVNSLKEFFTVKTSTAIVEKYGKADLFIGNNVLAHVPNMDDFIAAIAIILKENGVATLEFPHLLNMIKYNQFDTVYHEHYSYISYYAVQKSFARHGLTIFRIDELDTHGGSLRLYVSPAAANQPRDASVDEILAKEQAYHLDDGQTFTHYQRTIDTICHDFKKFIAKEKSKGKKIWAFGAAAKGNTFLNYCHIKDDMIEAIIDETPAKIGCLAPGSHIPILNMDALLKGHPDYIVILAWNWKNVIMDKLSFTADWGAKSITAIPTLEINNFKNKDNIKCKI
jgi:hypothetical protein